MLAVATAVGLATAIQAANQQPTSTGFEKLPKNTRVVTGLTDELNSDGHVMGDKPSYFFYAGSNSDDNESMIVEFTQADCDATDGKRPTGVAKFTGDDAKREKALQVSTGTDPLFRTFGQVSSTSMVEQPVGRDMYIDTLVQFTVTPHDDTVVPNADDKLMIYLKETKTVNDNCITNCSTNLVVLAGKYGAENVLSTNEYSLTHNDVVINPGEWYRLTVKVIPNIFNDDFSNDLGGPCVGFQILIDSIACSVAGEVIYDDDESFIDYLSDDAAELTSNNQLILPLKVGNALRGVGFAGEGKVDDFIYTATDPAATVVNFTLTYDTNKIDGVTFVINGVDKNAMELIEDVETNAIVKVTSIQFKEGFAFGAITPVGMTQTATGDAGINAMFTFDNGVKNASLYVTAIAAATYPTYVADADDTVKGNYDTWLGGVSGIAAGGDASGYENQFLLNQAASTTIADNALVIKSITENTNGGWDIVIGCSVEGVGLSTTEGENAQVCNGYLAVSYTSDLSGSWTKENINVTTGTEAGTVKVNVNKSGAKFMKVSLETTKTSTTQE